MTVTVVYDASVLCPNTLRDLLIRIAQAGMVRAKWSEQILDEMLNALARERPDIPTEKLAVLRERMNGALRDCLVSGYEPIIDGLQLPDKEDRHVLAAAIRCHAQIIVTANLRDFPPAALASWKVEAIAPDEFILDLIDLDAKRESSEAHAPTRAGRVRPCSR
jgi:predicted nucleic acid-binding protein